MARQRAAHGWIEARLSASSACQIGQANATGLLSCHSTGDAAATISRAPTPWSTPPWAAPAAAAPAAPALAPSRTRWVRGRAARLHLRACGATHALRELPSTVSILDLPFAVNTGQCISSCCTAVSHQGLMKRGSRSAPADETHAAQHASMPAGVSKGAPSTRAGMLVLVYSQEKRRPRHTQSSNVCCAYAENVHIRLPLGHSCRMRCLKRQQVPTRLRAHAFYTVRYR